MPENPGLSALGARETSLKDEGIGMRDQGQRPLLARLVASLLGVLLVLVPADRAPAQDNPLAAGWTLNGAGSNLRFQSVKKSTVVESSAVGGAGAIGGRLSGGRGYRAGPAEGGGLWRGPVGLSAALMLNPQPGDLFVAVAALPGQQFRLDIGHVRGHGVARRLRISGLDRVVDRAVLRQERVAD